MHREDHNFQIAHLMNELYNRINEAWLYQISACLVLNYE